MTGESLAEAVFKVVGGQCQTLDEAYDNETSVWGQICAKLGPEFKHRLDRYWAFLAFKRNDMKAKVSGLGYSSRDFH